MKLIQLVGAVSAIGTISLALAGTASADAVLSGPTGPNSTQNVTSDNSFSSTINNDNFVSIANDNSQFASSGNVIADDNTTVGNLASGAANNSNNTSTLVALNNPAAPGIGAVSGSTTGSGQGGTTGGSRTGSANPTGSFALGGQVLGASTGPAILPVTGPTVPIDVSALENAWHRQVIPAESNLEKNASFFSAGMLITATLLSLIGAAGSAVYIRRQDRRV